MKRIYFTVTNDLSYDQRMNRICGSLAAHGYSVTLVGRKLKTSLPLTKKSYFQNRLNCWFSNGKLFYIEFNIRLFLYLIFQKTDVICAIDLDTSLPVLAVCRIRKIARVYDAHELFCEMKEVVTRPFVYRCWKAVEKLAVPRFSAGYTVCRPIADEFESLYGVRYGVIRNVPLLEKRTILPAPEEKYILYQGAVNEGRGFEQLIPAMKTVHMQLIICGDGNFMQQARALVQQHGLTEKVQFKGMVAPQDLKAYTNNATIGLTLFENTGKSNYFSLANRFFDYIHAGIPQLCMNYPCYAEINQQFEVAVLINDLDPVTISAALNNLLNNDVLQDRLRQRCLDARQVYNWQQEERRLIELYRQIGK